MSLEKKLCDLFGGKVLYYPKEGYVRKVDDDLDREQWWLEKATELLIQPKPDKGILRAAIESQRISNPELAEKLKEKMRILR